MEGFGEVGTFWVVASFPLVLMENQDIFGFPLEVMEIGSFRAGFPLKVARSFWGGGLETFVGDFNGKLKGFEIVSIKSNGNNLFQGHRQRSCIFPVKVMEIA